MDYRKKSITDRNKKRQSSFDSAKMMAQSLALHEFTRLRMDLRKDGAAESAVRAAIMKKFNMVISSGTITNITYDQNDHCELLYTIQSEKIYFTLTANDLLK